jgi:hypothetical protein
MPTVAHKSLPEITRIDGRSCTARRVKIVAQRLKGEIDARRRWSYAELDELQRTATAIVLAEEAQRRALHGSVPFAEATKAAGHARRAQRDLKAMVIPKPERSLPSYSEIMAMADQS